MTGPLTGIRVLDLSAMLSGPWAASILGDQGAEVIKVEPPRTGDHVRSLPNRSGGLASMFLNVNRSKRSLTLDLKSEDGKKVLFDLVRRADVLVQNFRPGVVERLGISFDDLIAINPKLVYLSISGFGEGGPYSERRAYDPIVQAVSGLTTIQAGSDEDRPRLIRTVLPDKLTAITGAQAVCSALVARATTGEGQHVRLSMLDSVLAFMWASDMNAYTFVDKPVTPEKAASFIDLIYETADGYITVSTMSNKEWTAFCKAAERPDLLEDERFDTPAKRDANVNERLAEIQKILLERPGKEWLELLTEHDVPCAPALRRFEVIEDPQVIASGTIIETDHPIAGRLRQARVAARFSHTPVATPVGAPGLGQHSVEVLAEAGFDTSTIDRLLAEGVVGNETGEVPASDDETHVITQGA
ncbi:MULTISPECIES: CaiB/BaiF CoA transferase family protein [unclassified Nocardioides]|uniref:CaiB/BaiF CoA transferase family protein n=1 Tax=unclassified Nocardioides TaxID=2615069 RepID=UPI000702E74A|nr:MULTISPECIES: CoA transferase [unclassified Nocardioides]KRC46454.1 carnitine dehydratase [Nocardioides sp. Root79]KRC69798.1 carnitine dehydratase [Nocardioides sp. Root240]